ncbi:MAG: hypothetical protein JRH15_05630 [Deltaproteobacteria bacterium]|nr:hypothetical protein [Deltaproteobacteria bacterium]
MKDDLYKKMEQLFPVIEHRYQEIGPLELTIYQLARGNAFNPRVLGLEAIKRFRDKNPNCAITFKPNHLSEVDFLLLSLLFRENHMRVLTEGGANLFIDHIDVLKDLVPLFVNPAFQESMTDARLSLSEYLATRGAFKVFRESGNRTLADGTEVGIGKKDILTLSRAYRNHLVSNQEMYVTFPGYSSVKSGFMDLIKKDTIKTGRSYTGKFDGFHHLPFQMDIEASMDTGVPLYVVDVNIAYSPVLEDENFLELIKLQESGTSKNKIYLKDLGYILRSFCRDRRTGEMSIKFGEPVKIDTSGLKDPLKGRKVKRLAQGLAQETFENVMAMQPICPANIYFSAFEKGFERMPVHRMLETIDDIRDHLRHLVWEKGARPLDLLYVLDYRNHIYSADEIINRTFDMFNTPQKRITAVDGDMFVVYNKHVAMQYRNHIAHFLENMRREKTKKK